MNNNIKIAVIGFTLCLITACSSRHNGNAIDYSDDVETPDVLLQDAQGGDSEYGLDKNAQRHNQQNKPDMLEQSVGSSNRTATIGPRETKTAQPVKAVKPTQTEQRVTPKVVQQAKQVDKPKKTPTKQESALEVDDPLLGEIDPS